MLCMCNGFSGPYVYTKCVQMYIMYLFLYLYVYSFILFTSLSITFWFLSFYVLLNLYSMFTASPKKNIEKLNSHSNNGILMCYLFCGCFTGRFAYVSTEPMSSLENNGDPASLVQSNSGDLWRLLCQIGLNGKMFQKP